LIHPFFNSRWFRAVLLFALLFPAWAAEVIPPKPKRYFNDYAGVVSAPTEEELNSRLEAFEKETSSQVVVAIYSKMESKSSIEEYTVRVAQVWGVGQKDKRNGAVLFMFIADRKMFLQIGYGLEGAIPDAVAKQITEFEIKPHVQKSDYDSGLRAGVTAILQAAKGEYKGTGRTVNQQQQQTVNLSPYVFGFILLIWIIASLSRKKRRRGRVYRSSGWGPITWGGGDWGGGSGGGSWGGGSGGGFSSGGGSFGGGGAGSSW
jgi:uncharacterized protein